eukprot:CAMPEP_0178796870 /NCGR_PEP_ID=MMETSP0745-20121128/10900_1 /TAXON_ID=913974 /ORGANISM="Nitzschia punctata, Strain CCMP561" /LENGTH=104 /DNA_ID=CAMNT_0020455379 /DNA_START=338 /DNA_END=649 /DNA_ORIENTATION=+
MVHQLSTLIEGNHHQQRLGDDSKKNNNNNPNLFVSVHQTVQKTEDRNDDAATDIPYISYEVDSTFDELKRAIDSGKNDTAGQYLLDFAIVGGDLTDEFGMESPS